MVVIKVIIINDLTGDALKKLFSFTESYCDKFSMETDDYSGPLSQDERCKIYTEMSEFYSHQDAERRRKIKEDLSYQKLLTSFCCTEEEKYEHLDYCHANDQAYLKRLGYKLAVRGIDRHKIDHPDFLSRTISGLGINETGGLYCNSYFVIGDFYRDVRASIKNLFNSYVHGKDAMQKHIVFLNFIWYQDNIPFLTIHTDLKYAELNLEERQYGKFQNLGIKHTKK